MITAEQARELGQVSPVTVTLAMASVEQDVKAAAAQTTTVLHTGLASVDLAHGQTPSATALMHRVKELLLEKGFKVQFDIASVASGLGSSNRKYGIRISW
jgi:hypothetical protein